MKSELTELVEDLNTDWKKFKKWHAAEVTGLQTDMHDMKERVYSHKFNSNGGNLVNNEDMKAFGQYLRTVTAAA